MPYKSAAQRRFFHSAGAKREGISKKTVQEWDAASKGMHPPERLSPASKGHKGLAALRRVNR